VWSSFAPKMAERHNPIFEISWIETVEQVTHLPPCSHCTQPVRKTRAPRELQLEKPGLNRSHDEKSQYF
jgi:hypothetical protein